MTYFTRLPLSSAVQLAKNWHPRGSFETGYDGWVASTNASSLAAPFSKPTSSSPEKGPSCLKWTATGAGDSQVRGDTPNNIPTLPGETINVAADFLVGGVDRQCLVAFEFLDGSGALIGSAVLGPTVTASGLVWRTAEHSAVAPALTANTRVLLRVLAASAGQTLYADAVIVTKDGVPAVPYFDGATTDAPPLEYRWLGATYASASVKLMQTGSGDQLTPPLIVRPFAYSLPTRTLAHSLLQSDDVRYTLATPGAASGVMQLTYELEADAIAAMQYFKTPGEFVTADADLDALPAQFVVAGGELRYAQDDAALVFHVYVPWVATP